MSAACKYCPAAVQWARTGSNKPIMLDLEPTDNGNVELVAGVAKVWGTSHIWPTGTPRFKAHKATCPAFNPATVES